MRTNVNSLSWRGAGLSTELLQKKAGWILVFSFFTVMSRFGAFWWCICVCVVGLLVGLGFVFCVYFFFFFTSKCCFAMTLTYWASHSKT